MTARKKADPSVPAPARTRAEKAELEQEAQDSTAAPVLELNTEALAAFEQHLADMWPLQGQLVGVVCPLPGWRWLKVWFRVNNRQAVAEAFQTLPLTHNSGALIWKLLPHFVRGMEAIEDAEEQPPKGARELLASLDFDNPETFIHLSKQARELGPWMVGAGYKEAKEQPISFL